MRDISDMDELVYDSDYWSSCCGASIYSETDICSECGEHCDPESEEQQNYNNGDYNNDTNLKFKYQ
ncbi:hypothetical protein HN803_07165 [candidate division WWE3 bacterium]|jgi:hypothetical protein|nr:hypothetical protein [candidate division WWE3 bacterium]